MRAGGRAANRPRQAQGQCHYVTLPRCRALASTCSGALVLVSSVGCSACLPCLVKAANPVDLFFIPFALLTIPIRRGFLPLPCHCFQILRDRPTRCDGTGKRSAFGDFHRGNG